MVVPVGVESGGSRTWGSYGAPGNEKHLVGLLNDPTLGGTKSPEEIRNAMDLLFSVIRAAPALTDEVCLWFSAAGYANSSADFLEDTVRHAAAKQEVRGLAYIANDATTMLLEPPRLGNGVVAIVGTGSVVVGAEQGRSRKFSGDEWVAADIGSGFEIGWSGIHRAYAEYQGWEDDETELKELLVEWCSQQIEPAGPVHLDPSTVSLPKDERVPYVLRGIAALGTRVKPTVARFAYEVLNAAARGDAVADKILDEASTHIADFIARLCRWRQAVHDDTGSPRPLGTHEVTIDGSIGGHQEYFRRLEDYVAERCSGDLAIQLARGGTALLGSGRRPIPPSLVMARRVLEDEPSVRPVSEEFGFTRLELIGE